MEAVERALRGVRSRSPLVVNVTNLVVMNTTANALLALGASPVMSHEPEDLEDLVPQADAVVVNMGTLDRGWIYSMRRAVELARRHGKPVALDPVGSGATGLRTRTALELLALGVTAVRGNFGEVHSLVGGTGKTRGVDSRGFDVNQAGPLAAEAARRHGAVVSVSGPVDFVSDGVRTAAVKLRRGLGDLVGRVTGLGCMATAVLGAFLAVEEPYTAAWTAAAVMKAALRRAADGAQGPGSFHAAIYDWLYKVDGQVVADEVEHA